MVTSAVFIALIGTLLFKSAISAAINYEPIKITVNENFNSRPDQIFQELASFKPGTVHQGANFYFKPQLNLPSSYIPPHIEAFISSIQQHDHSCTKDNSKVVVEKDKLMEILKPFMYPLTDIPGETLSGSVHENENHLEIVKPSEMIPPSLEEISSKPHAVPIINTEDPKSVTPELLSIPEASVLPLLSYNGIAPVVEGVKREESVILEKPTGEFPTISEISVRPMPESIINNVEPKPVTSEVVAIPEATALPSLSIKDSDVVEEVVKVDKPILLPSPEPIVVDVKVKPIPEILVIPDAPILPPITFNSIPPIVEEEVKKQESLILNEPTSMFPTIPEISVRPISGSIINYVEPKLISSDLVIIPEAPVLPPRSHSDIHVVEKIKNEDAITLPNPEPIVIKVEPQPTTADILVIPNAPVLPLLSFNGIPLIVEQEVKKEDSKILEEPTGVLPTIPEISVRPIINYVEPNSVISELEVIPEAPVLPPLSLNDIHVVEETKIEEPILEPVIIDVEPKPATPELVAITEAPILPLLSFNGIPPVIEEEVKKEDSITFEEPTDVFPTISKISERPTINYFEPNPIISKLEVISEAPVLPPFSLNDIHVVQESKIEEPVLKPVMIEVLPKLETPELVAIPEAPVLPPLSFNGIPPTVEEEMKKEESIILKEPTGVFPTIPEISVRPTINFVESPPPITLELGIIPEGPAFPPFSLDDNHVVEESKIEEPILEPVILKVEPKFETPELVAIPEAPVLSPLSINGIPPIIEEEVKKEESIMLEEPMDLFPTIPEISGKPTISYFEPNPVISKVEVIPETPVLSPFSLNDYHVVEETKIEEPILKLVITEVDPEPATPKLVVIPEAPVLPPLSYNGIAPIVKELKIEETTKVGESRGVFPTISEPIISETAGSFALENLVFPAATEEVKIQKPVLLEKVFPPITEFVSGVTLQEPEITNTYVVKEVSGSNSTFKETLPTTIIEKPLNNQGVFNDVPFVSHFSKHASKSKQLTIPKPASLERFLLKEHPFRLPVTPFPKLSPSKTEFKKPFLLPRSYAHDIVEKRIAPNMALKKNAAPKRVKMYIRSNVPKGPSYL